VAIVAAASSSDSWVTGRLINFPRPRLAILGDAPAVAVIVSSNEIISLGDSNSSLIAGKQGTDLPGLDRRVMRTITPQWTDRISGLGVSAPGFIHRHAAIGFFDKTGLTVP